MKSLSKFLLLLGSTALLAACSLTTQPAKNTTPNETITPDDTTVQEQTIPDAEDLGVIIDDADIPEDEYQGPLDENGQPMENQVK